MKTENLKKLMEVRDGIGYQKSNYDERGHFLPQKAEEHEKRIKGLLDEVIADENENLIKENK